MPRWIGGYVVWQVLVCEVVQEAVSHLLRCDVSALRCVWQSVFVMLRGFQFMYFVVAFGDVFRCVGDGVRGAASAMVWSAATGWLRKKCLDVAWWCRL